MRFVSAVLVLTAEGVAVAWAGLRLVYLDRWAFALFCAAMTLIVTTLMAVSEMVNDWKADQKRVREARKHE